MPTVIQFSTYGQYGASSEVRFYRLEKYCTNIKKTVPFYYGKTRLSKLFLFPFYFIIRIFLILKFSKDSQILIFQSFIFPKIPWIFDWIVIYFLKKKGLKVIVDFDDPNWIYKPWKLFRSKFFLHSGCLSFSGESLSEKFSEEIDYTGPKYINFSIASCYLSNPIPYQHRDLSSGDFINVYWVGSDFSSYSLYSALGSLARLFPLKTVTVFCVGNLTESTRSKLKKDFGDILLLVFFPWTLQSERIAAALAPFALLTTFDSIFYECRDNFKFFNYLSYGSKVLIFDKSRLSSDNQKTLSRFRSSCWLISEDFANIDRLSAPDPEVISNFGRTPQDVIARREEMLRDCLCS